MEEQTSNDRTPCDPGIPEGITGLIRRYTA